MIEACDSHASAVLASAASSSGASAIISALDFTPSTLFSNTANVGFTSARASVATVQKAPSHSTSATLSSSAKVAPFSSWGSLVSSSAVMRVLIDSKAPLSFHLSQFVINKLIVFHMRDNDDAPTYINIDFRLSTVTRETLLLIQHGRWR